MTHATEDYIRQLRERDGTEAALTQATKMLKERDQQIAAWWSSNFYEMRETEGGRKKLWPTTEEHISRSYDLADLDDGQVPEFFYLDEQGALHPVTVGGRAPMNVDQEQPFIYASSDIVANGQVVGHVLHTDH